MEYLVPMLIVVLVVIVVTVVAWLMGRKTRPSQNAANSVPAGGNAKRHGREITREMAQEASAKLTPETHQSVYSLIARQQVLNAVKAYRSATGTSLGESAAAVAALAQFPQPSPAPAVASATESPLTVADIVAAAPVPAVAPAPHAYRYRAIVSQGEEVREVASTRLNEEIFGHVRALAQSGDYDGAARLLRDHADIGEEDAKEFVSMIEPDT